MTEERPGSPLTGAVSDPATVPGAEPEPVEPPAAQLTGTSAPAGGWRTATVAGVRRPIARAVELRLDVHDRIDHLPEAPEEPTRL